MKRWLETRGYLLCWDLAKLRIRGWPVGWLDRAWCAIWYRFYCPYPIKGNWTARSCVEAGNCGCRNLPRYAALPSAKGDQ